MPITSLVSARPEEQARAKSRLLNSAIERIRESGGELDLTAGLQAILVHIIRDRKFDQLDAQTLPKAQAIAIVTTNLGLEYATKGDVDKAVLALTRNPIEKIFTIGEKLNDELQVRVGKVLAKAVLSVRFANITTYLGVTDATTEAQLTVWHKKGVSDHAYLPLSTIEEYETVTKTLDRVERELYLASKVDWQEVFADYGASRFTLEIYRRQNKESCNHLGGVWKPFLLSLIVQAMTGGWSRNTRRLAFIDRQAVVEFVDLVTFEFNRVSERANTAAERILKVAHHKHERLFKDACSKSEVEEIFALVSGWMNDLASEAKRFCFGLDDLETASDVEVDRFWRTRLFLSSDVPYAVRVAESAELWRQLPQVKTLAALTRVVKDLALWPEGERENFLANTKIDPLLDAIPAEKQSAALYLFWRALGDERASAVYALTVVERGLINWTERFDLLLALRNETDYGRFIVAVNAAARRVRWDLDRVGKLKERRAFGAFIGTAFRELKPNLDNRERQQVITLAGSETLGAVDQIWSELTETERARDLFMFTGRDVSRLMMDWKWEAVEAFFRPLLAARAGEGDFRQQFVLWLDGRSRSHEAFVAGDNWREPFEELCKQHLGRPTSRDRRLASLPTGHPERKALDREINRELIARLAEERPWDRVAKATSLAELGETLRSFELWPEREQDRICFCRDGHEAEREFTTDHFDRLLDAEGDVKAQAEAIAKLRRAMREPFQTSSFIDTVLYKLFTWTDRAELIAELGSGKAIRSTSMLNLAREIAWPLTAVERVGTDKHLLEIALTRLVRPETEEDWIRACQQSVRCHLGAARQVWEQMPASYRPRLFMHFPAAFVAEFLKAESFEMARVIFEPMLAERGTDDDFRHQFKRWYEGRGSDTPSFAPPPEWQKDWREFTAEYLGWGTSAENTWYKMPLGDIRRDRMIVVPRGEPIWSKPPPWQQVDATTNLEELSACLVDFTFWPETERDKFYERFRLDPLLDEFGDPEAQAEGLVELWKIMGGRHRDNGFVRAMATRLINWTERSELVVKLNRKELGLSPELILVLAERAWWPISAIRQVRKPDELLMMAMTRVRPPIKPDEWRLFIERVGHHHGNVGRHIWQLMDDDSRRMQLTRFSGRMVSEIIEQWSWQQVQELLEPLLASKKGDGNFRNRFCDWYFGDGTAYGQSVAFTPASAWTSEIQALLAEYGFLGPRKNKAKKANK